MEESPRLVSKCFLPVAFGAASVAAPFALAGQIAPLIPFFLFFLGPITLLIELVLRCAVSPSFRQEFGEFAQTVEIPEDRVRQDETGLSIVHTDIVLGIKAPIL